MIENIQIVPRLSEPVSLSHWGMFEAPLPPMIVAPRDLEIDPRDDWNRPGALIWAAKA